MRKETGPDKKIIIALCPRHARFDDEGKSIYSTGKKLVR